MKEFVDDNFKFVKNGIKLSERLENTGGKEEIARNKQFLLFQQCFQKTCAADAWNYGLCGKGLCFPDHVVVLVNF